MHYITEAVELGKLSGNGVFTQKCQQYFEHRYGFKKCLLTTSCTDALEMAALLLEIQEGDEVIMPSFTFVSTANAFILRGAKIVFADSRQDHPGMDEDSIANLLTDKTKAIVVVHYAGVATDMDKIIAIANRFGIKIVEDAAQSIDGFYKGKPLGSLGHLSAFSFHETKNIQCGEGGMLVINDPKLFKRSEIIWEKGTNRAAFHRGEISKYEWIDLGSSFLPSELSAAFLFAQLERLDSIQGKRKEIWNHYYTLLKSSEKQHGFKLANIPDFADNNAHMFYLLFDHPDGRRKALEKLNSAGILAVSHYLPLHLSEFYLNSKGTSSNLKYSEHYAECLLRLPLFFELSFEEVEEIVRILLSKN